MLVKLSRHAQGLFQLPVRRDAIGMLREILKRLAMAASLNGLSHQSLIVGLHIPVLKKYLSLALGLPDTSHNCAAVLHEKLAHLGFCYETAHKSVEIEFLIFDKVFARLQGLTLMYLALQIIQPLAHV